MEAPSEGESVRGGKKNKVNKVSGQWDTAHTFLFH